MARQRYRRKHSALADLLDAPWPASVILALVVYASLKWALPAYGAGNMFLQPISIALASYAELAGGSLLLIAVLAYLRAVVRARKATEASAPKLAPDPANGPVHARVFHPRQEPGLKNPATGDTPVSASSAPAPQADARPGAWSIELIRDLEWKRFEDVCQRFYASKVNRPGFP
ncbi:MAG: hypothetical protein JSR69_04775, partial [Proteobacteria bacterium]|nr:hypothetical protein [Pseudomonadota bacterium]